MKQYHPYSARDAIKNYFPLPNEIFDLGLHSTAIAIYAFLIKSENRETYDCFPSYETIGEAIGVHSTTTVGKYVRELEDKGLIVTEQRKTLMKNGLKRDSTLLYHIRPIQEAIEAQYQVRMAQLEHAAAIQKAQKRAAKKGVEYKPPDGEQSA